MAAANKRTQADLDFDLAVGREIERKDAEIARLRTALEEIAEKGVKTGWGRTALARIARHALQQTPGA